MGKLFRIIIVSISLSCIYVSLINDYPYIYLLIAIFLIWINNILYGLEHFRRRIIFLGFNPVSYTHLDVYKRQAGGLGIRHCNACL